MDLVGKRQGQALTQTKLVEDGWRQERAKEVSSASKEAVSSESCVVHAGIRQARVSHAQTRVFAGQSSAEPRGLKNRKNMGLFKTRFWHEQRKFEQIVTTSKVAPSATIAFQHGCCSRDIAHS